MSVTDWKLEKDLCRCCHAEGSFKNLSVPCYKYDGEEEIYVDMIRDHMNLDIIQVQGALQSVTFTICDLCIAKLRDVTTFRRQVMSCEERFRDMYSRNVFKVGETTPDVKVEVIELDDFGDVKGEDNDDDDFTMNFSDEEDIKAEVLIDIKQEPSKKGKGKGKATPKAKKRPAPKRAAKAKKGKKAGGDGEEDKVDDADKAEDEAEATASLADTTKRASKRGSFEVILSQDEYRKLERGYACVRCQWSCTTLHTMRNHVKIAHYGWKPFQCDSCPDSFSTKTQFYNHLLEEHGVDNRIPCRACDAKLISKASLELHLKSVHKLGELFKCDQCSFESYRVEVLACHKQKHVEEKTFVCSYCEKAFKRKKNLMQHENIHTKSKMKACHFCTRTFVELTSLKYHLKKHHPNDV